MNQPALDTGAESASEEILASDRGSQETPDVIVPAAVRWRQRTMVLLWIVAADALLYHAEGYAGVAAFALAAPFLLFLGVWRPQRSSTSLLLAAMLPLAAVRLLWQGNTLLVLAATALVFALAMALSGGSPFVLETIAFVRNVIVGAGRQLARYRLIGQTSYAAEAPANQQGSTARSAVLLPLAVGLMFATIFVLANPNLVDLVTERASRWISVMGDWIANFSPWELVFWIVAGWIGLGLIRPALPLPLWDASNRPASAEPAEPVSSPWYPAFRNMLVTVIVLFAAYLVFEFRSLWFRVFPEDFYYAGYAHQGAAWLTVALALATAILSFVFRGAVLFERRIGVLRKLAWVWSALNLLLAVAVYNRLLIYIGFNGMTRMRMVGLLGISAVVIGFFLVVYKIVRDKRFLWLIRHQLLTVVVLAFAYAVAPVDWIAHRYNVWAVKTGNPRPAVQLAVKPIDNQGAFALLGLIDAEDPKIRQGIRAMLARREHRVAAAVAAQQHEWSRYQAVDHLLLRRLRALSSEKKLGNASADEITERIEAFRRYTEPWY